MTKIKAYTDLEQSRKLTEILPLESADMYYPYDLDSRKVLSIPIVKDDYCMPCIHCWSLAALLEVLPFHLIVNNQRYAFSMHKGLNKDGETYMLRYNIFNTDVCLYSTDYHNNPINACCELILKLNELKLL